MDKLYIFDTTLRDGEQSPGASMTLEEKVRIATYLEKLKVDIIEAGFAIASEGDFKSVQAVAQTVKESCVCSLARANQKDIDRAAEAIKHAHRPRIHTFIATSPIHMQMKLKLTPDQVLEQAVAAVKHARNYTDNVEFSPEDGGRSDIDFLCRVIEQAIAAGATTINIPDTVGYTLPKEFGNIFKQVIERVPNSHKAIFSAHCHNDLGLAVANSMAAVENGAKQIECTINGLGERAGNTALEEVVMAFKTRQSSINMDCNIATENLVPTSRLVAGITGFPVQPNKAIVGANAFAHEAGIHQDGILKSRETYEIMKAEDVGWNSNRLVLGKHSGKAALNDRLIQLGYQLNDEQLQDVFIKFKQLADRKHEIYDDDLHTFFINQQEKVSDKYQLLSLNVKCGTETKPCAEISLNIAGENKSATCSGDGAVDSTFKAIEKIVNSDSCLILYSVSNVTNGTDSQGEVAVRINQNDIIVNGIGYDTDIITASAKAYIDALNRLAHSNRAHPQLDVV